MARVTLARVRSALGAFAVLVALGGCGQPKRMPPAASAPAKAATGVITTVAGDGWASTPDKTGATRGRFRGDGGPAVKASLNRPGAIAIGPGGDLYIYDCGNKRVRRVDPKGTITTFAGGGEPEHAPGDGGPATEATFIAPWDVAVGPDGSVYIADAGDHRIRKVDRRGTITTVAGDGWKRKWKRKPNHDPYAAVVAAREPPSGRYTGDGGPATKASLNAPGSIAIDNDGSLYIVDAGNSRIRRVAPDGTITTVAHFQSPGYGLPRKIAVSNGVIYGVVRYRVMRMRPRGRPVALAGDGWHGDWGRGRFAGDGGPAVKASLNSPRDIALAPDGSLYVADTWNHRIRRIDRKGIITTVAGDGWNHDVVDPKGIPHATGRCHGDGGPAIKASLNRPQAISLDAAGNLYIADTGNHRIRRVRS